MSLRNDPVQIEQLSAVLQRVSHAIEQNEQERYTTIMRLLGEVEQEYTEATVRNVIRELTVLLRSVRKETRMLAEWYEQVSDRVRFAAHRYRQAELSARGIAGENVTKVAVKRQTKGFLRTGGRLIRANVPIKGRSNIALVSRRSREGLGKTPTSPSFDQHAQISPEIGSWIKESSSVVRQTQVQQLQQRLARLGYAVQVNGTIDNATMVALRTYQQQYGIVPTGGVGTMDEQTWLALFGEKRYHVTGSQLKQFGWFDTSDEFVQKLNEALLLYKVTDQKSVALLMATMAAESGYGRYKIEIGTKGKDGKVKGRSYPWIHRGAGYIQITWKSNHDEFLKSLKYTVEAIDKIKGGNTAQYIAEQYPIEASAWFWASVRRVREYEAQVDKKTGKTEMQPKKSQRSLDEIIVGSSKEHLLGVFLVTQYYVNGLVTKNKKVDPQFMRDLDAIMKGNRFEIKNEKLVIEGRTWRLPNGWKHRQEAYQKAINIFCP